MSNKGQLKPKKKQKNIDFIFEVIRMKLNQFFEASNVLDQKISVVIAFLATIVAGLSAFFSNNFKISLCPPTINSFSLGILFFMIAILLCVVAISAKKYYYPPDENYLYSNEALNSDIFDLKSQVIADTKESLKHNHKTHELKARLFNCSLWISIVGLIFVLAYFI